MRYEPDDLNALLRMAIADALKELSQINYGSPRTKRASGVLEDALRDKFSQENMDILFPPVVEIAAPENNGEEKKRTSRGWVELKTIKGYGPYAYLRWREGKRQRSKYIGKVETE